MRKYSLNLIELILSELKNGATVSELSKKYSVDHRRISEWKNNYTKTKIVEVLNKFESKPEIEKTITSTSKEENTLEDILNKNGISPDEWEVSNASINQWTDSKGVLHNQSKVNVVKKKISLELEIPAPISINISLPAFTNHYRTLKCAVILSDMQIGFRRNLDTGSLVAIHDRVAMNTALRITKALNPDRIVLLGDNLDLAEFSTKYTIPSDFYFTTQASIVELAWWLGRMRSLNTGAEIDYLAGNHECFSDDTEILTDQGWLHYSDVNEDIKIATFNKNTLEIEYQNYLNRQEYNYIGNMYSIVNSSIDLLITPNHRVYWASSKKENKFKMSKIENIELNNSRKVQYVSGVNNKNDYNISDEMIKLIAWIITDGSTDLKNKTIKIYQRKEKVFLITEILNNLKIPYTLHSRFRNITEICGTKLINETKEQCTIYINKLNSYEIYKFIDSKYVLPNWTYELSNRQVDIFINSMVDGDGSRKKDCKSCMMLYGIKDVLDQVQHLLVLNGYRTSIYTYRNNQYRLNIVKTNFSHLDRIKKYVNVINYSGKVWDFTVPNDTLVVRRNGKISITGNCRLEKYINNKAVSLNNLRRADELSGNPIISIPSLLGLKDLGIKYYDYPQGKVALNSNLVCIHGETAKGMSGATVSEVVKSARVSTIQGHIHRHEVATKTVWDAFDNYYMYTAASFGCLCRIDPGYVPGMKYRQNWQNGMGVVWYEDDGLEQFQTEFIPIVKGRALYKNSIFDAIKEQDIINIMEKDTKYKLS